MNDKYTVGNIPSTLKVFQKKPEVLSYHSFWDDFETDEQFVGSAVIPAFATDALNKKTHETAARWSGKKTGVDRPNTPISGLRIISLEKRSEGGRAWKVLTQDNLMFDLREDVLLDTILKSKINNGVIEAEFIFAIVGSQMKLIRVGSELHTRILAYMQRKEIKTIKAKDLVVGNTYENKKGDVFLFLGRFDNIEFDESGDIKLRADHCMMVKISNNWDKNVVINSFSLLNPCDFTLVKNPEYVCAHGPFNLPKDFWNKLVIRCLKYYREFLKERHTYTIIPDTVICNSLPVGSSGKLFDNKAEYEKAMKEKAKALPD